MLSNRSSVNMFLMEQRKYFKAGSKNVAIQCDEKVLVEADGELLGEGPVSFSVLPSALSIVV